MKVSLRLFFVRFHGSDEDGAEMGGSCRCGWRLGHGNTLVSGRNSEGDGEPVNVVMKSDSVQQGV